MKSGGNAWAWHWRRFTVDVLIGAATIAVVFAATGATAEIMSMLLIAGVLVGIGLMLEPNVTAQGASDIALQRSRPSVEPKAARPGPSAIMRLDAMIVEATSA